MHVKLFYRIVSYRIVFYNASKPIDRQTMNDNGYTPHSVLCRAAQTLWHAQPSRHVETVLLVQGWHVQSPAEPPTCHRGTADAAVPAAATPTFPEWRTGLADRCHPQWFHHPLHRSWICISIDEHDFVTVSIFLKLTFARTCGYGYGRYLPKSCFFRFSFANEILELWYDLSFFHKKLSFKQIFIWKKTFGNLFG